MVLRPLACGEYSLIAREASTTLELRIFAKPEMVLSALLFIGKTCEVVWTNLDLGNLKTKFLGEKCQKG